MEPPPEFRHNGVVELISEASGAAATASVVAPPVSSVPTSSVSSEGHTRSAIVQLLLEGPVTAGDIGRRLGISAAGIRRHLDALIEAGDAQASAAAAWQHSGRGRPAKRYRLTAAGRAKLSHAYDDLAAAAMRQLREIGGDAAVRTFARRRIDSILAGIPEVGDASRGARAVEQTADRMAVALTGAGYATTTTAVAGPLSGVQICQHHCPVSHVAEEFPELCDAEQEAFAEMLGTHVQRLATIVNGDFACTTHVPLISTPGYRPAGTEDSAPIRHTARPEPTTTQGVSP
ncbi:MAG: metalloregulator ArsR/SmtB family transcription factor [Mycobacterium sp.]